MKLIIFCGGSGTRLWPLSRHAFPKQFIKMFDGKSTFQLAIERIAPVFGIENIIISTTKAYRGYITEQLPELPLSNIIEEPEKRDLGPAVGLNLIHLKKIGYSGPVALLWADHLMENVQEFINGLKTAEAICTSDPKKVVLISEKPRFPNNNLGWIHFGEKDQSGCYAFAGFKYKPEFATCEDMFKSGEWDWNPGYMVYDVDNALGLFETFAPEVYSSLMKIYDAIGTVRETHVTSEVYPTIPKIHHDYIIPENLSSDNAVVVRSDMGWSDPGTLYALKEALTKTEADNLQMGTVKTLETSDTLIVNEEKNKLVTTIGLSGMVVVNTDDVLIVVPKTEILKVTELVNQLAEDAKTKKYT
ncbi:MAG TPA: sugar phosphate nucleotidyltransferase [Candidatus Saccharimonadales bacterium]|nr:sugar phosphate nucleotidyltransferase [Candidatus Saccharimonadales bacterium]